MTREEREEAKAFFQSRLDWKKENRYPYVSAQESKIYKIALEALNNSIEEIHWTPISEGLPKVKQYAFITVHDQTKMCWYQNGVFVDGEQNAYTKENEELVAWQPLQIPKPYKKEGSEE